MIKYYRHKKNTDVVCEVVLDVARFGRWVWKGNICSEVYTYKDVTDDFKKAFEEITADHFNECWGSKLQKA